jgi:hypothetical protein
MTGWWRCRRQAEIAILRRELRVAQQTSSFYRQMAVRFGRELEHYKSLSSVRGAEQDERSWQQAADVLGDVA